MRKRTTAAIVTASIVVMGGLWAADSARADVDTLSLSDQIAALNKKYSAEVMEGDQMAAQIMEQQAQIESLSGQVEQQKKKAASWKGKHATAQEDLAQVREENSDLAQDKSDLAQEVEDLSAQVTELSPEVWHGFTVGEVIVCPQGWSVSTDSTPDGQEWAACM